MELNKIDNIPKSDAFDAGKEKILNKSITLSPHFKVDRTAIPTVSENEQEKELWSLDIQVYQQEVLEKEILHQVDQALENKKQKELALQNEKRIQENEKFTKDVTQQNEEKKIEDEQKKEILDFESMTLKETEKEKKIRMGEMTPFGTVVSLKEIEGHSLENVKKYLNVQVKMTKARRGLKKKLVSKKHKNVKKQQKNYNFVLKKKNLFPKKKKDILGTMISEDVFDISKNPVKLLSEKTVMDTSDSEYYPEDSDSEDEDFGLKPRSIKKKRLKNKGKKPVSQELSHSSDKDCYDEEKYTLKRKKGKKEVDDGDEMNYLKRLEDWEKNNSKEETEIAIKLLSNGFKIPLFIWNKLYNYQRVGVQWLWELNLQRCGGILGDEMGLGKTIQVIAFMIGLSVSKLISKHGFFTGLGPVLIICPTTVMHQWVKEFHQWWAKFRVALLHESGTYKGKKSLLIRDIVKSNGILITSYVTCLQQSEDLLRYTWHYIILDEGHKIRNTESQIASTVKLFRTPHRLILSGSPMQNNLRELWSLFDFIFPGKLGTLPVFMANFAVPITQGGYANASKVEVSTAYKCATVLRDTISPYLLRRVKDDVKSHINLPSKNEQVLFCRLTDEQKELYVSYLNSGKVDDILSGKYKIFMGLIELRKICNHPHLFTGGPKLFKWENPFTIPEEDRFGFWKKAGKMIVVETLLKMWKKQGHRVLIFTQSRQMLRILEAFIQSQKYEYIRIDGTTNIGSRQPLINKFNQDKKYYIFLSTTHVGGLGVNLTGANRVIIYDPDWNPATDIQARERAWRIGQENQVTIYRLVTSGTIEEKIYHRQIFKQFLTNKILKDPRQRRFFKSNDLYELFTYKDSGNTNETSAIFAGTDYEVNLKKLNHKQKLQKIKDKIYLEKLSIKEAVDGQNVLTQEKIKKMKQMAQNLSKKIALEATEKKNCSCEMSVDKPDQIINISEDTSEVKLEENKNFSNNKNKSKGDKEKKRKRKKKKDSILEGEIVPYLQKQMEYQNVVKEFINDKANDDYILKKLLSKTGVQSALQHDQIMEEGSTDYALVEGEAEKIAKEATRALKDSKKYCIRTFEESLPNEALSTPRFGKKCFSQNLSFNLSINKNLYSQKNMPMSSSELLERIQQRSGLYSVSCNNSNKTLSEHCELLVDIRNFISFGGKMESKATTQEIIDKFKNRLPIEKTPLFKALLNEICEFYRPGSGEGIWKLRAEFR